jgi:radical SAM protein with 4Fe4S-binding SPASM domain
MHFPLEQGNSERGLDLNSESGFIGFGSMHPDRDELVRYFEERKPYSLQIESTLACPQGCLYCYVSSDGTTDRVLPEGTVRSILESASNMGVRAIDWLGGDPLEREGWYELMSYAKDHGLMNNVWTSGLPLSDPETAGRVVEVTEGGFISFHLDTLDEVLYGKLHKGDPREKISSILKGVDNILAHGKGPEEIFNCITFTKTLAGEDVKRTIEFFFKEKGVRTCLTHMCDIGSATEHPEWIPSLEEVREAVSIRDSMNYPDATISMSTMDVNKFYCGGAICVTVEGDVTPCSVIRKGFGNVNRTSLEKIFEMNRDSLLYETLREVKNLPGNCATCGNNSVCWGCRASAYYEEGDILARDPKCTLGGT